MGAFYNLAIAFSAMIQYLTNPFGSIDRPATELREMECVRMSMPQAHALYPDRFPERSRRGENLLGEFDDTMICRRFYLAGDERPARDEAILRTLTATTTGFAQHAAAMVPEAVTWLVDTVYPDAAVSSKVSTATRVELVARGRKVSNRVPFLAAGDLQVLGRITPREAFPLACKRFFDKEALGPDEALLGVALIDPRETQLHAGYCHRGVWRWLQ